MTGRTGSVTIVDIANDAGVSKSTVSLVLRGGGPVREETVEKIRASIKRLGYVYNRSASNLRSSKSNIIGIIVVDLTNSFYAQMVVGVERVFRSAGYVSFVANSGDDVLRQNEIVQAIREQGVAGVIVSPARGTPQDSFDSLLQDGVPVISAMRRLVGSRAPTIAPKNEEGAFAAVSHLLELGHRDIGFLGGFSNISVQQDRRAGYRRALEAAGLPSVPSYIQDCEVTQQSGELGIVRLLAANPKITAVLCYNDLVALGVLQYLRSSPRLGPAFLSVVGFDDLPEASLSWPTLTTVRLDAHALGERAAHSILRMISGGKPESESYETGVQLVVRDSCRAPDR